MCLRNTSQIPMREDTAWKSSESRQQLHLLLFFVPFCLQKGFPGGSDSKVSACNAGNPGSIPGLGRSSGEGNGNPLQYFCLENLMDGAWQATVHGVAKSRTQLSNFTSLPPATYIFITVSPQTQDLFYLHCLQFSSVAQLCPTLLDPMDCSLPGSIHRIFQARILQWVAISFSRVSSQPRDQTLVSCIAARRFTI